MPSLQKAEELIGVVRGPPHLRVGDDCVGAEDVVAVLRSVGDDGAVEDDGLGLPTVKVMPSM
jgi:hypothetical protein